MCNKTAIKLIVGLGNPDREYLKTRHNAGFWFVDAVASQFTATLHLETKFKGNIGVAIFPCANSHYSSQECKLLQPTTFMNLSGQSVIAVANFYKIPPEAILVVHDELDFSAGILRLKKGGGANGHNGVQNICNCLGSNDFYRLRIGIGRPSTPQAINDYVLQKPTSTELSSINTGIEYALTSLPLMIDGKLEAAMQYLNSKR